MQQKELQNCSQEILKSFSNNKQLTLSLKNSFVQKNIIKNRFSPNNSPKNLRFMSGKEYVKQARLELQSMPIQKQEQEEFLKQRPNFIRQSRTKLMIENQIKSRREKHLYTMDEFAKFTENYQLEELTVYEDIQRNNKKLIDEIKTNAQSYIDSLNDQTLIKKETEFLNEIEDFYINYQNDQKNSMNGLDKKLTQALETYKNKFYQMINTLQNELMDIQYILEPEILKMKSIYLEDFQKQIQNIQTRNQIFIEKIDNDKKQSCHEFEEKKNQIIHNWRQLKHDKSIQVFLEDISKEDFIFPTQNQELYKVIIQQKKFNEVNKSIFNNRISLLNQLQNLPIEKLSALTSENFNKESQKLNEYVPQQQRVNQNLMTCLSYLQNLLNQINKNKIKEFKFYINNFIYIIYLLIKKQIIQLFKNINH